MAIELNRVQRVAQEIKKEIANIFYRKIKDPRVKMITISEVKISRDFAYAKVFVTFLNKLNQDNEIDIIKNGIKILNGDMMKYIRSLLGKSMCLRIVPKLIFFYDSSLLKGIYMTNLVNNVIRNDERRHFSIKDKKRNNESSQ
ncbi:MAG: 30S ribosome-binding factor RbfA [Arsenophonus sp. ET-DL9-MAG3]